MGSSQRESSEAIHPVWAEIDLDRLERNHHELIRRVKPGMKVIASIKANAYGHGVVPIAKELARLGVYGFATGNFKEAAAVREAGIDAKILMLATCLPEGVPDLLRHDLIPTVYNMDLANAVSKAASETSAVYIKVDAGLGRVGVPLAEAADFVGRVAALPRVRVEGVYTHLPFFDETGREWARRRLQAFDDFLEELAERGIDIAVTQARASADIVTGLEDRCNAVCVGHALYGVSPVAPTLWDSSAFKPVLRSIRTRLIHVVEHRPGAEIWVGGQYAVNKKKMTGVVPVGMANGYRNAIDGRHGYALIRGRRVPVLGVALEQTVLDLDGVTAPQLGDEIVLLGEDGGDCIAIDEMAAWSGVTVLELLMTLNDRLPYRYRNTADDVWSSFGQTGRGSERGLKQAIADGR